MLVTSSLLCRILVFAISAIAESCFSVRSQYMIEKSISQNDVVSVITFSIDIYYLLNNKARALYSRQYRVSNLFLQIN